LQQQSWGQQLKLQQLQQQAQHQVQAAMICLEGGVVNQVAGVGLSLSRPTSTPACVALPAVHCRLQGLQACAAVCVRFELGPTCESGFQLRSNCGPTAVQQHGAAARPGVAGRPPPVTRATRRLAAGVRNRAGAGSGIAQCHCRYEGSRAGRCQGEGANGR